MSRFEAERSAVLADGLEERVGVNQRALIDKILARYATPHSTYRELLQNSNDAGAARAEVRFATAPAPGAGAPVVREAVYRNDGAVFNRADWARLTTIASGNPNPDHVGFFGVGAFTLFSIAEEPMVLSGARALVFKWKGDALFTKLADRAAGDDVWTSFVLPARDPYPVPAMDDFGEFLSNSLTFTKTLAHVEVFVDDVSVLRISKTVPRPPTVIAAPAGKSWWNRNAAVLGSPRSIFALAAQDGSLTDTRINLSVRCGPETCAAASISARVVSAAVVSKVPPDLRRRMVRVTKKEPIARFALQVLLPDAGPDEDPAATDDASLRRARGVLARFSPRLGGGRVYIGFRTSQTTGVACHLAAPLIPTVEREAIDLVDPTLAIWNSELLHIAGVVMRLALEHGMLEVDGAWKAEVASRASTEDARLARVEDAVRKLCQGPAPEEAAAARADVAAGEETKPSKSRGLLSGFASFMGQAASEVRRIAAVAVASVADDSTNLLVSPDPDPLSGAERAAIVLMRSFEPAKSTPDTRVGSIVARGFEGCFPSLGVPVITQAGVLRGNEAFSPSNGIDRFFTRNSAPLVRNVVVQNAGHYVKHVCGVRPVSVNALSEHLKTRICAEDEVLLLLIWFCQYARKNPGDVSFVPSLKSSVRMRFKGAERATRLSTLPYYVQKDSPLVGVPLPTSTLPVAFSSRLPSRVAHDAMLESWFAPLLWRNWVSFICGHEALVAKRGEEADALRETILSALASEYVRTERFARDRADVTTFLKSNLSSRACMPTTSGGLEVPPDVYLPDAELEAFSGVGLSKVSASLMKKRYMSKGFLTSLGVREAVSVDVLLSELDRLRWNRNPAGLIQYLNSVSSKITSDEWSRLKRTRFLPSEADEELHTPGELCLPSRDLKGLLFPFLKWNGRLSSSDPEVDILCSKLGVQRLPPLGRLLDIAADTAVPAASRSACIWFAAKRLDDVDGEYAKEVSRSSSVLSKKFLPCRRLGTQTPKSEEETQLCAPSECYLSEHCAELGFWSVRQDFERAAMRFNVQREPPGRLYVRRLLEVVRAAKALEDSKADDASKSVWHYIELLGPRVSAIDAQDRKTLQDVSFIPVKSSQGGKLTWRRPSDVYFGDASKSSDANDSSVTQSLFDTVKENDLLRAVGVRAEPTLADLCQIVSENPKEVFARLGTPHRYELLLQRIGSQVGSIPRQYVALMKKSPFLLAHQLGSEPTGTDASGASSEGEDAPAVRTARYFLAKAEDIVVVDDAYLQRMFKPPCAPLDSSLEAFYVFMGSQYLSRTVSRKFVLDIRRGIPQVTPLATELKERILQRKALILEASNRGLHQNAKLLFGESALHVREVYGIKSVLTLKGKSCTQSVTCCPSNLLDTKQSGIAMSAPPGTKLMVICTQDLDFFDVANAIGPRVFARCSLQDVFLLAQLLETTLSQLRARGFPVDRIITPAKPPVEPRRPSPDSVTNPSGSNHSSGATATRPPSGAPASGSRGDGGYGQILQNMFPDVDRAWLEKELKGGSGQERLLDVKKKMEREGYPKAGGGLAAGADNESSRGGSRDSSSSSVGPGGMAKNVLRRSLMKPWKRSTSASGGKEPLLGGRGLGGSGGSGGGGLAAGGSAPELGGGPGAGGSGPGAGGSGPGAGGSGPGAGGSGPGATGGGVVGGGGALVGGSVPGNVKVNDEQAQSGVRSALHAAVNATSAVPASGVTAPSRPVAAGAAAAAASEPCEVISGQDLTPLRDGRGAATKTPHGYRVFVSRLDADVPASLAFCQAQWGPLCDFSALLRDLAGVFGVRPAAVAVFYSRGGNTIAFNAGGGLHFNFRYYHALHAARSRAAYVYWYTTFAHELSHNLVKEHNQQHGHFTECFVAEYFERLLAVLP